MSENKRTDSQIKSDRAFIAELLRKGDIHQEITDKINERYLNNNIEIQLTRQQISYDIKKVRRIWQEEIIEDVNEIIINEIQNLKWIEKEAKLAWLTSKGWHKKKTNKTRLSDSKDTNGEQSGKDDYVEESETEEFFAGDPRFLVIAKDCSDKVTKLYGIFKKSDEEDPLADPDNEETVVEVRIPDNGRD